MVEEPPHATNATLMLTATSSKSDWRNVIVGLHAAHPWRFLFTTSIIFKLARVSFFDLKNGSDYTPILLVRDIVKQIRELPRDAQQHAVRWHAASSIAGNRSRLAREFPSARMSADWGSLTLLDVWGLARLPCEGMACRESPLDDF